MQFAVLGLCFCTQLSVPLFQYRYSFAEIRYHRQEEIRKGRVVPAHVETVVIFLPDVWTCCPSRLDWHATLSAYHSHLESKLLAVSGDEDSSRADMKASLAIVVLFKFVVVVDINSGSSRVTSRSCVVCSFADSLFS